jgi:acyl carrier protein
MPGTLPDVKRGVIDILAEAMVINPLEIVFSSRLEEDLGVEPTDFLYIILCLEKTFGCKIPEGALSSCKTVADLAVYVESLTSR